MKIYLASSYSRRQEMAAHAETLRALGHEITSRWITGCHELGDVPTDEDRARLADEDWDDLVVADAIVSFTEGKHFAGKGRGGRHVEFGVALGIPRMRLILIGPRENVFHFLPQVEQYDSLDQWIAAEVQP